MHIQLALLAVLVLLGLVLAYNKYQSSDEHFVENIQPEETTGPRKEVVLTEESQCYSLCEENGNRPNVLLAFDPRFQQYNTVECIYECKKFVDTIKNKSA